MTFKPGPVVLLGSGETSPNIRKVYDKLFRRLETPVHVAILETPAGFEPNSEFVAAQIAEYLTKRLQNYRPRVTLVPARKKGTQLSPDNPELMGPLYDADVLFTGPGSPTYAARQFRDSVAWHTLQACHRLGATVIFASAATIACSAMALPVYEIYKVGEDLHWKPGLDFFGVYGLNLIFVPHWNNNDGGADLDTSHCYIGTARYDALVDMLPASTGNPAAGNPPTIVGIDENTALVFEPADGTCWVQGPGSVTIIRDGNTTHFAGGTSFPATEFGPFHLPEPGARLPADMWDAVSRETSAARQRRAATPTPSADVLALAEARQDARAARDWALADTLRDQIAAAGWLVQDTANGPVLEPLPQPHS